MTLKQQIALHKKAEKAMRSAIFQVVQEHKKKGTPLVIWKDGKGAYVEARKLKMSL